MMEGERVIRERRSIRAYTEQPVPEAVVRELLETASWAPSWRNTQAWRVWAVTGEALATFKREFRAAALERREPPQLDLPGTTEWPQPYASRMEQLAASRAATLAAAGLPSDPASSLSSMADVFGAPCLLVFGFDERLAEGYACYDMGSYVQNLCLAAQARGLGTCISGVLVAQPQVLRALLPDAEGMRFVVAVTLGYPDERAAINTFERSRAPVDDFVRWVEKEASS